MLPSDCPCGSGERYDHCCGRLHRGAALAESPVELMRARYAAYAVGDLDFVFATWHPRTRPSFEELQGSPQPEWTGLEVHGYDEDRVEFTAWFRNPSGGVDQLHERSRFARRAGRWFYLDGDLS